LFTSHVKCTTYLEKFGKSNFFSTVARLVIMSIRSWRSS